MKKYFAILVIACAFSFLVPEIEVCARFARHLTSTAHAQEGPVAADPSARIARIENGLLPAATIKGQSPARMNLAERMKHYNVPGVSIAFFENGQIAWTRGYGFADVANGRRVTAETLFQSASISKPQAALALLGFCQES